MNQDVANENLKTLPRDHWAKALRRISGRIHRNMKSQGDNPEIDMTSALKRDLRMLMDYMKEYEKA